MDATLPRYLYKYRSLATKDDVRHTAEIFEDHTLYLAAAEQYNDPFECRFKLLFQAPDNVKIQKFAAVIRGKVPGISQEEAEEQARKLIHGPPRPPTGHMEETVTSNMVDLVRKEMGILSLTENRDSILMWSHYANSHEGVCIQFDTGVGEESTSVLRGAMPVQASDRTPELDYFRSSAVDIFYVIAATKSDVWGYEREWRVVKADAARTKVSFPSEALSGVILGKEISQENKDLVLGWVAKQNHDVTVEQAALHPDTYSLTFSPWTV